MGPPIHIRASVLSTSTPHIQFKAAPHLPLLLPTLQQTWAINSRRCSLRRPSLQRKNSQTRPARSSSCPAPPAELVKNSPKYSTRTMPKSTSQPDPPKRPQKLSNPSRPHFLILKAQSNSSISTSTIYPQSKHLQKSFCPKRRSSTCYGIMQV